MLLEELRHNRDLKPSPEATSAEPGPVKVDLQAATPPSRSGCPTHGSIIGMGGIRPAWKFTHRSPQPTPYHRRHPFPRTPSVN